MTGLGHLMMWREAMKRAGCAIIFELGDMIASADCTAETIVERQGTRYVKWVRAVPEPFYDGLFARIRSAWEIIRGRAFPILWPKAGDLERALGTYEPSTPGGSLLRPVSRALPPKTSEHAAANSWNYRETLKPFE